MITKLFSEFILEMWLLEKKGAVLWVAVTDKDSQHYAVGMWVSCIT